MRVRVDFGGRTFLGVCECTRRYLAMSHERALERLADHEREVHPGDNHARSALAAYRKRQAAKKRRARDAATRRVDAES